MADPALARQIAEVSSGVEVQVVDGAGHLIHDELASRERWPRILIPVIEISRRAYADMVAAALDAYPLEACGLIAGPPASDGGAGDRAPIFYPCANTAESARVYTIDPKDHLRAERDADDRDFEINGVVHSHTHSEPYPSPTDVASAPDPSWHYVIISLKREAPEARSYRIVDGEITEESVVVV